MKLLLAFVSTRKGRAKCGPAEALAAEYVARAAKFCPTEVAAFDSEAALLSAAERLPGRPAARLILFDSRGESLRSEDFAESLGRMRDEGAARIMLGVGPADGWSAGALARAQRVLSLGKMTLPHELARAVVAEQMYRALTILAGHPYHGGH